MNNITLQFGKGVNKDAIPSELAPGFWSDVLNVRSRGGFEESWEGASQIVIGAGAPVWVTPYSSSGTRYAVYATATTVRVTSISGGAQITRFTDGQVVSSMTASGTTVTVETLTAHGLSNGNTIYAYGAIPATYNAEGVAVTVVDATHYTYTVASAPASSPATVNGAYSGNATSNFSGGTTTDRWSGGAYQGLVLMNHPTYGLYYWNGDTGKRMRKMPNWPYTAPTVRAFKEFIFILGTKQDGTADSNWVTWSTPAENGAIPTSFVSTDTNEAGGVPLASSGGMVDCLPLGDLNIIYKQDSVWAAQYAPGSGAVFNFTRLPGSSGLLTRGAVVDTPVGHVYLTTDYDVKVHNGGESRSIAQGRILNYLRRNFDRTKPYAAFLAVNPQKNEVWVCVPFGTTTLAGRIAGRAFVWNWEDDAWGILDLTANANTTSGLNFGAAGGFPVPTVGAADLSQVLYLCNANTLNSTYSDLHVALAVNDGTDGRFNGGFLTCTLERVGLDFGDRTRTKSISRSRWNFKSDDLSQMGTATVYHGWHSDPDHAPDYGTSSAYIPQAGQADWADGFATYRHYQAIKATYSAGVADGSTSIRTVDVEYRIGGKR